MPVVPATILASLRDLAAPKASPRRELRRPTGAVGSNLPGSPSTRAFLRGEYADGPNWNSRLFSAACDLKGRDRDLEEAEDLLLTGASPWNGQEREAALATIRSAYRQDREPGRG